MVKLLITATKKLISVKATPQYPTTAIVCKNSCHFLSKILIDENIKECISQKAFGTLHNDEERITANNNQSQLRKELDKNKFLPLKNRVEKIQQFQLMMDTKTRNGQL